VSTAVLPLSLSQQEVWMDQRAWPGSTHLNIGGAGFIDGPFDLERFRQALALLVAESQALRLVPLAEGGQRLLADWQPELEMVDVSAADDPRAAMQAWWQSRIAEPFPFDGRPPWRFALLRHSDTLHGLSIQFHHLVMDGWGTSRVMQRWAELYNALAEGCPVVATNGPDYLAFIAESLEYRNSAAFARDAAFWTEQLPQLPPPLFERRHGVAAGGILPPAHLHSTLWPRADYGRLQQAAARSGTNVFALLIAVFAAYLAHACGRHQVVIGLPSLNRGGKRYRDTLGMFVGVFPLVVTVEPGQSFAQLLTAVTADLKQAVRHQRYPLSDLARRLELIRHRRDSLFDVLFSFERQDYDLHFGAGRSFGALQTFSGRARYPLGITLCEFQAGQDVELNLEASPAFFSAPELAWLGRRLISLAVAMAEAPAQAIEEFPLCSPDELAALERLAGTALPAAAVSATYVGQFRRQAAATPAATALVWDGGALDYAGLDAWSNRLAGQLRQLGAARDTVVAIAIERSPAMIAALLAIGKAGAAFLPLDPDAPLARLESILADAAAIALLIQPASAGRYTSLPIRCFAVSPADDISGESGHLPLPAGDDLAYVLYTSGSTGRPKGVMVGHRALAARLAAIAALFEVQPTDRSGQATQLAFDPALIELLVPLTHGASVALAPPGRLAPGALGPFALRHQVTMMALVPSTLLGLLDSLPRQQKPALRIACCGGEVLAPELVRRFHEQTAARLLNVYGPTEAIIFATAWVCPPRLSDSALPIGYAVAGTRIRILDERGQPLPFGVAGEICIGGAALAQGYLNRSAATQQAFIADPLFAGERLYRSGDIGWLATDGLLHFVGRRDRQVKLRGYRVELGEIETLLLAGEGVRQAAVKLVNGSGRPALHAWVAGPVPLAVDRLRRHLAVRLPDYMLPAGFSCLPELPLGATGKIAYDLLPEPAPAAADIASRPPSGHLERSLLALWRLALKNEKLGVTDNFFAAGGDSLAAVDILAGIETLLGRAVPLFQLTEHPTVEQLAAMLAGGERAGGNEVVLPLSRQQGRLPLYLAASGHGDLIRFRQLADALGDSCEVFMLQPPTGSAVTRIDELAAEYARHIVDIGRPGLLAGFSVGGITALETVRQLRAAGFPVPQLCLIDAVYPGSILRSAVFWRVLGWAARHLHAQELSLNGRHLGALFSDQGLLAQIRAIASYQPEPWVGDVSLIKSSGLLRCDRWAFKPWRKLMGPALQEYAVPGLHGSVFEAANIGELAQALRSCLGACSPEGAS
jgi:amino acid adenylation domain-containing protein